MMHETKFTLKYSHILYLYLILYFIFNLFTLDTFPYVHSDEPWLSGLSRSMVEHKDLSITEPFFDVYGRNPHAIRSIFHIIQGVFIQIFDYSIYTLRLVSLLFSMGSLFVFYKLSKLIFSSEKIALISVVILSSDLHYIYSSHLARQEILILFIMILTVYLALSRLEEHTIYKDILIGGFIGLGIGIHPNSFIAALVVGSVYLLLIVYKKLKCKNLAVLVLVVSIVAIIFVALSIQMDPDFIENYRVRGAQFGVNRSILEKFGAVRDFYRNLYWGKSVTYYIPNIKFQLWMYPLSLLLTILLSVKSKHLNSKIRIQSILIAIIFVNIGIIAIGRYNVTSIVFIFPYLYLLVLYILLAIGNSKKGLILLLLCITMTTTLYYLPSYTSTYNRYISNFTSHVDQGAKVLSNLNTEYYFKEGNLLDYRNLHFLSAQKISFEEYVLSRKIEYIIYYEEMDYIYKVHPVYNGVYGDVTSYYDELQTFLKDRCQRIHSFVDSTYGTNIVRLMDERDWKIEIYEVK